MYTYEERISIRRFVSFKEAQPHLDTLLSILANFEITTDYQKDLPVCVIAKFLYPVKKEEE